MCGIAGFFTPERPAESSLLGMMCNQIIHRGPDDAGYFVDSGCAIGMRRLSIIDLAGGHQPIPNEDESMWVVFNGEIYNHQELRNDLLGRGHRFRTRSDTEVILHAYEEYGVESLARLRGMFAIALWDARDRSLLLGRDRFGKKPLYYTEQNGGLYFGSELKCLRAVPQLEFDLDPEAMRQYFQFNYIPDPRSPYRQVKKLSPGGWLQFRQNRQAVQGRYWKLPEPATQAEPGWTPEQAASAVREKFDEAVRIRLMSDVPLGAFLSGGIDSSSVVASMARQLKEPVKTFSIGFEEAEFDELPWARQVAGFYGTDHHEMVVRPDSISLVEKLVHHFDEPFGDSSAIPTYLVSEFAREHVTVTLTGDGGDELFAGYESFFSLAAEQRRLDRLPAAARALLSALADNLPYSAYGKNYLRVISRPTALERYFEKSYTPYFLRRKLLADEWVPPAESAWLERTFSDCLVPGGDILTRALYFEATAKLTGDMLVKVDRASMATSLEVRCPLLDHELAELAMRIPPQWNLRHGKGKQVLVDAMRERLPAGLLDRPKKGFGVPLPIWMRTSLRDYLHDHLLGKAFLERGYVSGEFVRHLLAEHESGRRNNYHWLWMLLMFERWLALAAPASTRNSPRSVVHA